MNKHLPVVLLTLFFTMSCADELIDDFERGESKNLRGGYWYYFSDVKDGGNSEILNAEMLSLGNYSAPRPVKEGSDSGYCLELKYVLGDQMPVVLMDFPRQKQFEYCPVTGLGTDIARNGGVADISSAYGIRFKARSRDSIIIIFELVTANIYDYQYYRAYFQVHSEWRHFRVDFDDSEQFNVPDERYDDPLMLSKVQKMNWHVASCFDNIYYENDDFVIDGHSNPDSGSFYLDDIWLLDSSTVNINHTRTRPDNWLHTSVVAGDLMGRRIKNLNILDQISGIYIIKNRKLLKLNTGHIGK